MSETAIPKEFWGTVSPDEMREMVRTNRLNAKLCKRLWAMEGRIDTPPPYLELFFDADQVDAVLGKKQ